MDIRKRSQEGGLGAESGITSPEPQRPKRWVVVSLMVVALILVAAFLYVLPYLPGMLQKAGSELSSQLGGSSTNTAQTTGTDTSQGPNVYSPLILGGSANLTYPANYDTLAAYAVEIINQDRANFSLGPVTLSPNHVGQQHADSMLTYDYFSHNDTQGYKPYMRYSLMGGTGAVFENVAFISYTGTHYTSVAAVEDSLKLLESQMMYNDSACCNNGHRINILNPLHNRVSIGIAYNSTTLFFDEDFENYYVNMTVNVSSTDTVTLQGTPLSSKVTSAEALIAYDAPPVNKTPYQLNNGPHEYGIGTVTGGVLPRSSAPAQFTQGITVYASTWEFTSSRVDISFSLSGFINKYGSGVYTIYLMTGSDTNSAITSVSIFIG